MCLPGGCAGSSWTPMSAPVGHKIGPAQLMRLIQEARARFDPEATEADRRRGSGSSGTSTSSSPRSPTTGPCTSRATWTSPTPSTSTPPSPRAPPSSSRSAPPSHCTCVGPRRSARVGPRTARVRIPDPRGRRPGEHRSRGCRAARWCCTPTSPPRRSSATPQSRGPGLQRRPGRGDPRGVDHGADPPVVRQPRHHRHPPPGHRPGRAHPRHVLRNLPTGSRSRRPSSATAPAPTPTAPDPP